MFDDVRISVASNKIHSTLKSSPGGRNGFLMVLGRCRRVWRLYDFDVVWIWEYFFVHATRHSPAWHLITPYLCHSITNHNIHLKLCRSMASSSGIRPRESTDREGKKCARAVLSESFRKWRTMIEYDWDMLRYWFGMFKWSFAWRTLKCDSCSCRSSTQFTISNQHLSS